MFLKVWFRNLCIRNTWGASKNGHLRLSQSQSPIPNIWKHQYQIGSPSGSNSSLFRLVIMLIQRALREEQVAQALSICDQEMMEAQGKFQSLCWVRGIQINPINRDHHIWVYCPILSCLVFSNTSPAHQNLKKQTNQVPQSRACCLC